MPAATTTSEQNHKGAINRIVPAILILLCGALVTVYVYFNALDSEDEAIKSRFEYAIQIHEESLTQTINRKLSALRSIQTLFTFSDEVTRDEFEGAASLAFKQGIPAVEWVPIISHSDRANFEARAQEFGLKDYAIKQLEAGQKLIVAEEQEEYYPTLFVYPMQEYADSLGLNIKGLPNREELQYAIKTSQPVASAKLQLLQKHPRSDNWIISIPVYEAEYFLDEINISRPQPPRGFLQAVINLEEFFALAWDRHDTYHLHTTVTDISNKEIPIPFWQDPHIHKNEFSFNALTQTKSFRALQREWQITFYDTPELREDTRTNTPLYTLIVGTVISCLLAAFVYHLLLIRQEVEQQVEERTRDLQIANQQLNEEISERRKSEEARIQLEEQLRHSQKMEAIGTLAGGIAHDFNNILAAVLGYIELIRDEVSDRQNVTANISELEKACYRARDLVRQILTFSRQKDDQRHIIQPAAIVQEAIKLTRATTPVGVTIKQEIDDHVWSIEADPTQIHQIALNLITNASHAIGQNSGKIHVGLRGIEFDEPEETLEAIIPAGRYVCLSIKDNGCGMSSETLNRIFEPYFTTKATGQGTGMGLSMVHGIVRSHGGYLAVHSTPGMGTRFDIYFPAQVTEPDIIPTGKDTTELGTQQHIVVVDDEEPITSLIEINLKKQGYLVKTFNDSVKCLQYLQNTQDSLDLLITDSAMPDISGAELIIETRKQHPELPIILYSGRISDGDIEEFESLGLEAVLRKPVSFTEIHDCITRLLKNTTP
ncbi:MAG: CHASE domain-containing protein [Verrucomicrobiota bacterium]